MSWLEELKEGDTVIITGLTIGFARNGREVAQVEAVTKTQIRAGGSVFNRANGSQRGRQRFYSQNLVEATPDLIAEVKAERRKRYLVRRLTDFNYSELSLETLEAIVAIPQRPVADRKHDEDEA